MFDLATGRDPRPCVATLQALEYGWVAFIRSIEAVTLLGRGFGKIIQPIRFDGMCPRWNSLPPDMYYLAASAYDLKKIMTIFGNEWARPPETVHGLVWHCPGDVVEHCQCQSHGFSGRLRKVFKQHHNPVQVFYPRNWHQYLRLGGPDRLADAGAIVFGHNVEWKYCWKEDGDEDLEECHDPLHVLSNEGQIITESIGFSFRSSTRADSLSVASRGSQSHESSENTPSTSLFADSNVNSALAQTSVKPELSYSSIELLIQGEMQGQRRPRQLRRE